MDVSGSRYWKHFSSSPSLERKLQGNVKYYVETVCIFAQSQSLLVSYVWSIVEHEFSGQTGLNGLNMENFNIYWNISDAWNQTWSPS